MKNESSTSIVPIKKFARGFTLVIIMLFITMACEDGLLLNERNATPELSTTDAANLTSSSSSLPHTNVTQLDLPVTVNYEVQFYECSNNPGPFIYFSGIASTGGFGVRTIFRNNMKGTHEYEDEKNIDVSLLPAGSQITIPKQPSRGGVGGNPYIYVQFEDAQGNPVSNEIFIGRCVQGSSFKGSQNVLSKSTSYVDYQVSGCANSPGPSITFDAGFTINGLNARIIFRNNVKGTHEAVVESSSVAQVIKPNMAFTFPKQPVLGGVGGNPWIWTQFLDGKAAAISDEILLGRCEQLSKAL
jgi:hypothetical protein